MDFAEVLSRAWQVVWKNKILWLFGFFAGCGQQGSFSFNYSFDFPSLDYTSGAPPEFSEFPPEAVPIFLTIMALAFVFIIIAYLLGVFGRLGVILGVMGAEAGEENLSFGELFNRSQPYFGRALLLNFLVLLAWIVIAFVIFIGVFVIALFTFGIGMLCIIPLMCLLVPVAWMISAVIEQANVALVVEDLPVGEAFSRGWNVVKDNFGTMLVLGLILVVGGFIISMIISAPFLAIVVPILAGLVGGTREAAFGGGAFALLCFVVYLPILMVVSGIVQAYVKSIWTLTFLRLTSGTPPVIDAEPLPEAV